MSRTLTVARLQFLAASGNVSETLDPDGVPRELAAPARCNPCPVIRSLASRKPRRDKNVPPTLQGLPLPLLLRMPPEDRGR
jgi:hypothetical protein